MGRVSRLCLLGMGTFLVAAGCGSPPSNALVGSVSHGRVNLQLVDAAGSNLSSSHIAANMVTVLFRDAATGTTAIYVAGFEDRGGGAYFKRWDLTIGISGEPAPGMAYTFGAGQLGTPGSATGMMQDAAGTWNAGGGTITVTSRVGSQVTFGLDRVAMVPGLDGAVGTFSMIGALTITNIDNVCNCIN